MEHKTTEIYNNKTNKEILISSLELNGDEKTTYCFR